MPYFQRKSYAETIANMVRTPSGEAAAEAALLERAAAILKEESTQLPKYPSHPALPAPGAPAVAAAPAPLEDIVILQPKLAVRPGQTANLAITVTNDSDSATVCTVSATDLVSVSGAAIGKNQVRISPPEASIAPGASADFTIAIDVPPGTPPGQYGGLLAVSGWEAVHAVLTVKVIS
jgi:FtsP/CotA-like multicopper oxidase with cupredoxin domain